MFLLNVSTIEKLMRTYRLNYAIKLAEIKAKSKSIFKEQQNYLSVRIEAA